MAGERESKLRLTLERMRTEFARGTPAADAHEMARSVFAHNMSDAADGAERLQTDDVVKPST